MFFSVMDVLFSLVSFFDRHIRGSSRAGVHVTGFDTTSYIADMALCRLNIFTRVSVTFLIYCVFVCFPSFIYLFISFPLNWCNFPSRHPLTYFPYFFFLLFLLSSVLRFSSCWYLRIKWLNASGNRMIKATAWNKNVTSTRGDKSKGKMPRSLAFFIRVQYLLTGEEKEGTMMMIMMMAVMRVGTREGASFFLLIPSQPVCFISPVPSSSFFSEIALELISLPTYCLPPRGHY